MKKRDKKIIDMYKKNWLPSATPSIFFSSQRKRLTIKPLKLSQIVAFESAMANLSDAVAFSLETATKWLDENSVDYNVTDLVFPA